MAASSSLTAALLGKAVQLHRAPGTRQCKNPARSSGAPRLRQLADGPLDVCVELLLAESPEGRPCCILPPGGADAPTCSGKATCLPDLISLEGLHAGNLASRLAAVDGTVAQTTECTAASADGGAAASAPAPSPLAYSPPFSAFLERCLELTDTHKELGPAPAVLLLQIVSRLSYAADPALREAFRRRFYLPLRVALEAAVDLHEKAIAPQVSVALFEAWAAMGATPMHSPSFGRILREQTRLRAFTPQEVSRLLLAQAAIRGANPSYRPCQYALADACAALLGSDLEALATPHLAAVATALGEFCPWQVYQCVVPLLTAVTREAVRRAAAGELPPPAGAALVAMALASARSLNPRIGEELEAAVAGWRAHERPATGGQHNILSLSSKGSAGRAGGDAGGDAGHELPLATIEALMR